MRILIFGAGVIGSLYAALLAEAGYDVSVYARGRRLESLTRDGLLYKRKGEIRKAPVNVLSRLEADDLYDLVFLTVRENQLHAALEELRQNSSPTVVTMVNSLETYDQWEAICGAGRIIPAFPGAGGGFDGNVLDAALTPRRENRWKRKRSRPCSQPGEDSISDRAGHARLAAVSSGHGRADRRRVL